MPGEVHMRDSTRTRRVTGWLSAVLAGIALAGLLPVSARAQSDDSAQAREAQSISGRIGTRILELIEREAVDDWNGASAGYAELLDRSDLTGFERATLLKLFGRARYELDDTTGTIEAWRSAIALDVLPEEDANILRVNTGQILLGQGELRPGITLIEAALSRGLELNSDIAMRLAQGYGQLNDNRSGLRYAQRAFDLAEEPGRSHYSILLYFFQQLDLVPQQTELMAQMVARWPDDKANWSSYASLLARSGREQDAFEVNRIMYLNGMLTTSAELVRLAQYYSYYEYPYGGAGMLEREMNAGRVDPTPENFQQLANLWRQAREWDRALPVLRRVATLTGAGPDYEKLGEALYQSGDFSEAEAMFVQALNRGGLDRPGDTWSLVGTTRVEMDDLEGAIDAFERALAWEYSRAGAQGWIDFVERKIAIINDQRRFEQMTAIETCQLQIERDRRAPALGPEWFDSAGQRIFDLGPDCLEYFTPYGVLRPEYERV